MNTNSARVLRGGAFVYDRNVVRCAYRYFGAPDLRFVDVGFRVVVSRPRRVLRGGAWNLSVDCTRSGSVNQNYESTNCGFRVVARSPSRTPKVIRSGSWRGRQEWAKSATRSWTAESERGDDCGFRVVSE